MAGGMPYGLSSMLKEGHKHLEEPVIKNIEACKQLSVLTRTSMGPQGDHTSNIKRCCGFFMASTSSLTNVLDGAGMNKMVINHLDKLIVTSDASTIISELEVEHPAAKLLALAARAQEQEIGDATNLVSAARGHCRDIRFLGLEMV
jgi:T-complex protein 1 subunit theta